MKPGLWFDPARLVYRCKKCNFIIPKDSQEGCSYCANLLKRYGTVVGHELDATYKTDVIRRYLREHIGYKYLKSVGIIVERGD